MGALGGGLFFMSEVPLFDNLRCSEGVRFRQNSEEEEQLENREDEEEVHLRVWGLQGYLAHKKTCTPEAHHRYRATVESCGVAFSYERGTHDGIRVEG